VLLDGVRILQVGCGIAGDMAGALLGRLGAKILRLQPARCAACGEYCDADADWRARFQVRKTSVRSQAQGAGPTSSLLTQVAPIHGLILDGVTTEECSAWSDHVHAERLPTVVFCTVGLNEDSYESVIEAYGLGGEAVSGVAGTIGPREGPPTPFGYLFGEANVAVRGAGMLVDRLLLAARDPDAAALAEPMIEASAADACIDAMDGTWQEYSLPGPVHDAPNSLFASRYARTGPQRPGIVPYGLFRSRDGWVGLASAASQMLAEKLNRPDLLTDPRFATIEGRVAHREYVIDLLQEWISTFDSGEEFVSYLGSGTVVAGTKRLDEIADDDVLLGFNSATAPFHISFQQPA
jgi:crotonobetainyl-CoA:carnitine CoA-transferase CaiB-like acyl-CoA transferase